MDMMKRYLREIQIFTQPETYRKRQPDVGYFGFCQFLYPYTPLNVFFQKSDMIL